MKRRYELVVLLHPDLEIDPETPIAKIKKLIAVGDGVVAKQDNWGKKRLAYPVKKHQFAVYIYFELELNPENVRQLEGSLLITEEVIRFLIVSYQESQRTSHESKNGRHVRESQKVTDIVIETDKEPVSAKGGSSGQKL